MLLGVATAIAAGAGFGILWVWQNGGLRRFRDWFRTIEARAKDETITNITRAMNAVLKPPVSADSVDELVAGLDEIRRSNDRAAARTRGITRGYWTSIALVGVVALAWLADQFERGDGDIAHALVVVAGLLVVAAAWNIVPLVRVISEHGVPEKSESTGQVPTSGAVSEEEAAVAPPERQLEQRREQPIQPAAEMAVVPQEKERRKPRRSKTNAPVARE
ncbi:MAG: hypothetical protein HYS27_04885 [Deltaproteobacteria bacterium]|nr:hypothetical protein [Deltaproteobacteria bacterium]